MIDLKQRIQSADPKIFGKEFDAKNPTLADAQKALDATLDVNETFPGIGTGRNVFLCLPQYKNTNPLTLFSLLALFDRATTMAKMHWGDAFIAHTRNKLAKAFLESPAEWSLWVDDDMVLPIGDAAWFKGVTQLNVPDEVAGRHTLTRLLSHKKTVVGGLYFGRSARGKPMFYEGTALPGVAEALRTQRSAGELRETRWVGTGCLLVHRKVFEDIQTKFPHLAPKAGSVDDFAFFTPHPDRVIFALEEAGRAKTPEERQKALDEALKASNVYRQTIGEDVTFCARATYSGHPVHVDTGLVCGHLGNHAYGPSNTTNA